MIHKTLYSSKRGLVLPMLGLFIAYLTSGTAYADDQRIVSVAGSLTEIVYALDSAERLVGVDTTSQYPPQARELPQVGYQRSLSAEGILSLQPDRVLATDNAGPPAVLEQLRAAGIPVSVITYARSPAGVYQKVRAVAEVLGKEAQGELLVAQIRDEVEQVRRTIQDMPTPKVMFLLSAEQGVPMVSGCDTAADAIIQLAGGQNALPEFSGYKLLSSEALTAAAPAVVVLPEHTMAALGDKAKLAEIPGMILTPAWRTQRIVTMDALLLLGFGPRLGTAVQMLSQHLHPQLATGQARLEP